MFFDSFDLFFDPNFYRFNRAVKDQAPYRIKRYDDGLILVHNVLGINPKDITVDIENDKATSYIVIRGETKDEVTNTTYDVNSRFAVNADEIADIQYQLRNGLLYVHIAYKQVHKPRINVSENSDLINRYINTNNQKYINKIESKYDNNDKDK